MNRFLAVVLAPTLSVAFGALNSSAEPEESREQSPFDILAFHLPIRLERMPMEETRRAIDEIAACGYNLLFLGLGGANRAAYEVSTLGQVDFFGASHGDMAELVSYVRDSGMEPVIAVHIVGKQAHVVGKLARQYPGLMSEGAEREKGIVNHRFRFPDGRTAQEALVENVIDQMLALYGDRQPRYFLIANDEMPVDPMAEFGAAEGMTAADFFADAINQSADHLLNKGVTPILFSDMLLSKKLAEPGHGVEGFDADPRFAIHSGQTNAEFFSQKHSVVTAINAIRNRNRIIMADWHYNETQEFPSVDYLQAMGFRDVWGMTWYREDNIRAFARYAAAHGARGMSASVWNLSGAQGYSGSLYRGALHNSIVYFRNPDFEPPASQVSIAIAPGDSPDAVEATPCALPASTKEIVVAISLPDLSGLKGARAAAFLESDQNAQAEEPLALAGDGRAWRGRIALPPAPANRPPVYGLIVEMTDARSGYIRRETLRGAFALGAAARLAPPGKSDWLSIDFAPLRHDAASPGLALAAGRFAGIVSWSPISGAGGPMLGAFDSARASDAMVWPSSGFWLAALHNGFAIETVFRRTGDLAGSTHCAVVSCGKYQVGFRLLMDSQHCLLLQFGGGEDGGAPLAIRIPDVVPANEWTHFEARISSPDAQGRRTVRAQMNKGAPIEKSMRRNILPAPDFPLGLGVEYRQPNMSSKTWPAFPGQIRSLRIDSIPAP